MPKQGQRTDKLSFIGGFNTEANIVNFPADYTIDEFNFELKLDGSRERRLGLSIERPSFPSANVFDNNHSYYIWKNVASRADLNFIVIQDNNELYLFDVENEPFINGYKCSCVLDSFSGNICSYASIDGKLIVVDGDEQIAVCVYDSDTNSISVTYRRLFVRDQWGVEESTSGIVSDRTLTSSFEILEFGKGTYSVNFVTNFTNTPTITFEANNTLVSFVLTSSSASGFTVQYNVPPYSIEKTVVTWKAVGTINEPSESSDNQRVGDNIYRRYNLLNQGWNIARKNSAGSFVDPIDYFASGHGNLLPAANESVYTGLQFQSGYWNGSAWTEPWERMYLHMYDDSMESTATKIAKGAFIIDLLNRGASRNTACSSNSARYPSVKAVSVPRQDRTKGGPTCVCDFSGHVFFGGFNGEVTDGDNRSPNLSSYIAFSKLVKSISDIGKCYQEGDPTSRESNDLLDTDGGLIRISGAENILSMRVCSKGLLVFASNGVWLILGGSDYGFTATNYKQQKLTEFGAISRNSIIGEDSNIFYWGEDGIYQIAPDQFGDLQTNKVSLTTIQTFFNNIPYENRGKVNGSYDSISKKLRWIYESNDDYTDELVLDLSLKAFTKNRFYHTVFKSKIITPISLLSPHYIEDENEDSSVRKYYSTIYLVAMQDRYYTYVTDDDGNIVYDKDNKPIIDQTIYQYGFTFAKCINRSFKDFYEIDDIGKDAKAYMITGCNTAGDSGIAKQIPYLILYFKKTEIQKDIEGPARESSCLVSSRWDWSNSSNSHRWSPKFQAYRIRQPVLLTNDNLEISDYDVVITKNKIRGRGKSFAFYIETEEGKDCKLLGWNITLNGNSIT